MAALEKQTGIFNGVRLAWVLLLLFAGAILSLGAGFYLDSTVTLWMVEHKDRGLRHFMRLVSKVGDWPAHIAVALLFLAWAWHRGKRTWVRLLFAMMLACAVAGILNRAVKIGVGRPRPGLEAGLAWRPLTMNNDFQSFPSGHTAATVGFFGVLLVRRPRLGLALWPIPVLIAVSRMYLTAHYLSDIFAASAIGLVSALLVVWWMERKGEGLRGPPTPAR